MPILIRYWRGQDGITTMIDEGNNQGTIVIQAATIQPRTEAFPLPFPKDLIAQVTI